MSIKNFTIPFEAGKESFIEEEINKFCLNKKINRMEPQFFINDKRAYWTVFVEYEEILENEKPQTQTALNEPEKLLYKRLAQWRKSKAESEGVPVYIVSTNSELVELIQKAPKSLETMRIN
ncbi:MAG: HRDC domain-containing protein [Nitrospirae bacterium]|nr:HRDC domain-containing protein [Nitrospirota bacterium]